MSTSSAKFDGGGRDTCPIPRQTLAGEWTSVSTSPAKFGGGGGQMSLPPPPNLAVEVDKCLYLPRQLLVDGRTDRPTLKAISRPASARAAGKKICSGERAVGTVEFSCHVANYFLSVESDAVQSHMYCTCCISLLSTSQCIRWRVG